MTLGGGLGGCGIGNLTSPNTRSTLEAATTLTPREGRTPIAITMTLL